MGEALKGLGGESPSPFAISKLYLSIIDHAVHCIKTPIAPSHLAVKPTLDMGQESTTNLLLDFPFLP